MPRSLFSRPRRLESERGRELSLHKRLGGLKLETQCLESRELTSVGEVAVIHADRATHRERRVGERQRIDVRGIAIGKVVHHLVVVTSFDSKGLVGLENNLASCHLRRVARSKSAGRVSCERSRDTDEATYLLDNLSQLVRAIQTLDSDQVTPFELVPVFRLHNGCDKATQIRSNAQERVYEAQRSGRKVKRKGIKLSRRLTDTIEAVGVRQRVDEMVSFDNDGLVAKQVLSKHLWRGEEL